MHLMLLEILLNCFIVNPSITLSWLIDVERNSNIMNFWLLSSDVCLSSCQILSARVEPAPELVEHVDVL